MRFVMHGIGNKNLEMKTSLILLLTVFSSFIASAQYNAEEDLISRFRPGTMWWFTGLKPAEEEKVRKYDRLIFDLTYNDWIGDEDLFNISLPSLGLNSNLMFDIPITKGNTVSFGIGGCYGFSTIRHDRAMYSDFYTKETTLYPETVSSGYKKNVLVMHNFAMPLEFRFRTKGWKHFKVHVGGKVGYNASIYNKSKYVVEEASYIIKSRDLFDTARLTYSTHIRIGIRNWALYGQYAINPMFTKAGSTKLNHIQMGLSVSLF